MDDPATVRLIECVGKGDRDTQGLGDVQWTARQPFCERWPLDELGDDERRCRRFVSEIDRRADVGVLQCRQ